MTKLRTAMPVVVIGAAVLFVLLIVLEWGMDISGMNRNRVPSNEKIGIINGHAISYKEFNAEYDVQLEQQKQQRPDLPEDMDQQIREMVWERFVNDALIQSLLDKVGMGISDEEIRDVLIDNPPAYLRRQFTDSLGNFDLAAYQNVITSIANYQGSGQSDQDRRMDTMYKALLKIEDNIRQSRLQEKFQSVLSAAVLISDADVHEKFFVDNAKVDVAYAFYDEGQIPNEAVSVSDDEVKAYFDKHSDEYQQLPTRKAKYGFINVVPSTTDSLSVIKKMTVLVDSLHAVQDTAHQSAIFNLFSSRYNELDKQSDAFLKPQEMSPGKAVMVLGVPVNGYSGIVADQDGYHMYHVIDERPGDREYAHFLQIVMPYGPDKDLTKAKCEHLIQQINTVEEATFDKAAAQFSVDQASANHGGDVGYIAKGTLPKAIDNAVFSAPIAKIIGPIESDAGYVIIRVLNRVNREIKVQDLRMTVHISSQTRQMAEHVAQDFQDRIAKGENIDSVAGKLKIRVFESQPLQRSMPLLGSQEFTQWVFSAKLGDVSEPKKLRGNTVVLYVSEIRDKGVRPFEEAKPLIKQKLIHSRKVDNLMVRAKGVINALRGDSIEHIRKYDSTVQVQYAPNLQSRGAVPGIGSDYAFNATAFALENINQMSDPVRGQRGVYILQLRGKALPSDSMYVLQKDVIRNSLLQQRKQIFTQQWIEKQKETAKIEDNREKFFRN